MSGGTCFTVRGQDDFTMQGGEARANLCLKRREYSVSVTHVDFCTSHRPVKMQYQKFKFVLLADGILVFVSEFDSQQDS